MKIKVTDRTLVVFDLDDTLYEEYDYLKSAFHEIAFKIDSNSGDKLFKEMLRLFLKKENVFKKIAEDYNGVVADDLIAAYRNHIPEISLREGAAELINQLKNEHAILALITDGRSITQRNKIHALGIADSFDHIAVSEELQTEKKSGMAYKMLDDLYPDFDKISIGDNIHKDFHWPSKHGWMTIGIRDNGNNIHSQLKTSESVEPQFYINSFAELTISNGE